MKEPVKVSVVTVCRNSEKTIEQTIKSVVSQSYGNLEYIIVDGASTDGTMDIVHRYEEHIARYVSEPDGGLYDAMNKGIDMATGELIAFLNSDDWYEPNAIRKVVEKYVETGADVIHGKTNIIEEDRVSVKKIVGFNKNIQWLYLCLIITHQACFVKLELMKKYHFDTNYRLASDYKFLLQIMDDGYTFAYLEEVIVNFCLGGISRKQHLWVKEQHEIARKLINEKYRLTQQYGLELEKLYRHRLNLVILNRLHRYHKDMTYLKKAFPELSNLYLFGTGDVAKQTYAVLKKINVPVEAFVDNDAEKHDTYFMGKKIVSLNSLLEVPDASIMIATDLYDTEIRRQLFEMNIDKSRIYSCIDWVSEAVRCYIKALSLDCAIDI